MTPDDFFKEFTSNFVHRGTAMFLAVVWFMFGIVIGLVFGVNFDIKYKFLEAGYEETFHGTIYQEPDEPVDIPDLSIYKNPTET